jgi:hypothetical protein
MAASSSKDLEGILHKLSQTLSSHDYKQCPALLSRAKISLLSLNALTPLPNTPSSHLILARQTLELGALISIRLQDPDAFTRYYTQLTPFYSLPSSTLSPSHSQQSKITGLYLLLLLTKGDYAGFHTCLESLMIEDAAKVEGDVYVSYPVKLEQWLMEGAYDRVWEATTKKGGEPSEEFGVFSGVSRVLKFGFLRMVFSRTDGHGEIGSDSHDPLGNCFVQRKGISFVADIKCQKPPLPR